MDSGVIDTRKPTAAKARILVVDDDVSICNTLVGFLENFGYSAEAICDGEKAVEVVRLSVVDLVLIDFCLPETSGVELLRRLQSIDNRLLGIVLTDRGMTMNTVWDMGTEAFDFITKPFDLEVMAVRIQRALDFKKLKEENHRLQLAVGEKYRFGNFVGTSMAMKAACVLMEKATDTNDAVMIVGEKGTKKEFVAQTIHYNSYRRDKPLISVNCRAIPENLIESELFGYERDAVAGTGAMYVGCFEQAHGGTLFLGEVGEMSLPIQEKLLRVIRELSFERVGGQQPIQVDVRVIVSTSQTLDQVVADKTFFGDLYRKLAVILVAIPPLRDRVSDIPLLVEQCLAKLNSEQQSELEGVSHEALCLLEQHTWPGNIRELENVLERIITLKCYGIIEQEDVSENIWCGGMVLSKPSSSKMKDVQYVLPDVTSRIATGKSWGQDGSIDLSKSLDELENHLIMEALRRAKGVKSRAAKLLQMNRTTLVEKLKKKGFSKF